jgi:quinol-cytochrome oxidoreductase complex cytochrome b subunit
LRVNPLFRCPKKRGKLNDSIKDIVYVVPAGAFVRNVHRWSAHVMVVLVFLHMTRVFFTASYKRGRGFNWVIGILLLAVTLALSFTGYLLPWDQLAYWAVTIGANIASSPSELTDALGVTEQFDIGSAIRHLLLGSNDIGDDAVLRFYFLHCIFLPMLMLILVGVHFWRIRKDGGLTRPDDILESELAGIPVDDDAERSHGADEPPATMRVLGIVPGTSPNVDKGPSGTVASWPHALRSELAAAAFITAVTLVLAYFLDAPLKEAANPLVPENPAKAPWYFLGLQELVGYSAFTGGLVVPSLAMLGLASVPLLDRSPGPVGRWFDDAHGKRLALVSAVFATVVTVGLLAFTVRYGWFRTWWPDINQLWVIVFNPGSLLVVLYAAWSITVIGRSSSLRSGAIALYTCFLIGFIILTYFAAVHRGPNWEFYWWPSMWSGH